MTEAQRRGNLKKTPPQTSFRRVARVMFHHAFGGGSNRRSRLGVCMAPRHNFLLDCYQSLPFLNADIVLEDCCLAVLPHSKCHFNRSLDGKIRYHGEHDDSSEGRQST